MSLPRVPFINRDVLALVLTLLLSAILLFTRTSPQIQQLKFQFSWLATTIAYPVTWYNSVFITREENKLLKEKLIQFTLMNSELESYHQENRRLKEMLNFSESNPLNLLTANVVSHNFGLPIQSITIDIGKEDGVVKNLTVMDENGLLGKTIQVGNQAALTQLITDKNFRVSIRVGQDRTLGLFIPTHGKYGLLEGVRKSMPLHEGEIAFTSGISEIYPPNIPVARVISVERDDNNPFQHVVVELVGSLGNFDYVFVIL